MVFLNNNYRIFGRGKRVDHISVCCKHWTLGRSSWSYSNNLGSLNIEWGDKCNLHPDVHLVSHFWWTIWSKQTMHWMFTLLCGSAIKEMHGDKSTRSTEQLLGGGIRMPSDMVACLEDNLIVIIIRNIMNKRSDVKRFFIASLVMQ